MSDSHLSKLLNTAVIASKIPRARNTHARFQELLNGPAFQAILTAVKLHAQNAQIPEEQAAQEIVQAFRELDGIWDDYIFQEGLDRLKSQISQ